MINKWWERVQSDPVFMRKLNGWLTLAWLAAAMPIAVFFSHSIPLLVFISVYANVAGHLSAWQAGRVEVEQARVALKKEKEDPAGEILNRMKEDPEIPTHN